MRIRIWNNLANIKFKAFYSARSSSLAGCCGRLYSFFLSLSSAGSVAAWAIWDKYQIVWAIIVGCAQILHVAKPYIPFLGKEKDFLSASYDYDTLYLKYERLWYDLENEKIEKQEIEKLFYKYRQEEIDLEKRHKASSCPEINFITKKAQKDLNTYLALNYEMENTNE